MGKLTSGRVKRTPQTGLTTDRYQYLALEQAEPNLGDALVGPSSIGANPIPVGPYFNSVTIGNKPGERYWSPPLGINPFLGVISVYNNGFLPDNTFNQITGLNFVGSGVTIETPAIPFSNDIGIATIRITNTTASNFVVSGIVTATGGFISVANTTPITINLIGNKLTFSAVGIGSTTFTLS